MDVSKASARGTRSDAIGSVLALWRYPVKSMLGEQIALGRFSERGLAGDRAFALIDRATGKIASAKNPRKWYRLVTFTANTVKESGADGGLPTVAITFADGRMARSDQPDIDAILSAALEREVTLSSEPPGVPRLEKFWPDLENSSSQENVTEEQITLGTFFDGDPVHLVTSASLEALRRAFPNSAFDSRRFRPNLVIALPGAAPAFVENSWIGRTIVIGGGVRLRIKRPTKRCVITTLPLDGLPRDLGILRAAAQLNQAAVGVYAAVARPGAVHPGDTVTFA
jgi:MOSC domain-containing protein